MTHVHQRRYVARVKRLLVCVLSVGACAHSGLPADHGHHGAETPVTLPHHLIDGTSGAPITDAAFDDQLRAARVIYVGEEHPNPHHHAAQIEVLTRALTLEPRVALGLEMLPRTLQPEVDKYLANTLDDAQFVAAVDWPKTWGFPFGLYRPLLALCRDHHQPAYALNAPKGLTRAVSHKGIEGLSADEKKELPEMVPGPEEHRAYVREALAGHDMGHGKPTPEQMERFYLAQLVWDETMAESIAKALAAEGAPAKMVVVAGVGHTRRVAIPERAKRRGAQPYVTIVPVLEKDVAEALAKKAGDVLWVLELPKAGHDVWAVEQGGK